MTEIQHEIHPREWMRKSISINLTKTITMYIILKECYQSLHVCLFGPLVHNLQSPCHSMAPSDYEQVSSKIHPLRLNICY